MFEWFPSEQRTPEQNRMLLSVVAMIVGALVGGFVPRAWADVHSFAFWLAVGGVVYWSRPRHFSPRA